MPYVGTDVSAIPGIQLSPKANEPHVRPARLLGRQPVSIQLRYLQTLTEIGVEKNTTLVFPVPVDIFSHFMEPVPYVASPRVTGKTR